MQGAVCEQNKVPASPWGEAVLLGQTMSKTNTYVTCHMVVGAMKIK